MTRRLDGALFGNDAQVDAELRAAFGQKGRLRRHHDRRVKDDRGRDRSGGRASSGRWVGALSEVASSSLVTMSLPGLDVDAAKLRDVCGRSGVLRLEVFASAGTSRRSLRSCRWFSVGGLI